MLQFKGFGKRLTEARMTTSVVLVGLGRDDGMATSYGGIMPLIEGSCSLQRSLSSSALFSFFDAREGWRTEGGMERRGRRSMTMGTPRLRVKEGEVRCGFWRARDGEVR